LDVLRVLAGTGERVVQFGVLQAAGVMCGRERQEGGLAPANS
jgi:hypothetical protein